MQYLIIILFIIVYLIFGLEIGYYYGSPLYTHFTYMFQHAAILHLLINSIAYISIFRSLKKLCGIRTIIVCSVISAFIASFFAVYDIPTVGASSMVYAMFGHYIGITLISKDIKIADTKKYLLFISCLMVSLVVSLVKQSSNFLLHLFSLISGFVIAAILLLSKQDKSTLQ